MTNKELQDILKKLPGSLEVVVYWDFENLEQEIESVGIVHRETGQPIISIGEVNRFRIGEKYEELYNVNLSD